MAISPATALSAPHFPPTTTPFTAAHFRRTDETSDTVFYNSPRIGVFHIDDRAVRALTQFYAETLPVDADILDICSSWVSHLPESYVPASLTVLGMNEAELEANPRATKRVVQDLNKKPVLPFADCSFDVVTNVVSVDYLTRPLEVFKETARVLRPGGVAHVSFSNRCFPTKAIALWAETGDAEHVFIVGCYFEFCGGFERAVVKDISPGVFGLSDPMYVVSGRKII